MHEKVIGWSQDEVNVIRKDFPMLQQKVNNRNLVYLDNAATTHKPTAVIDCMKEFDSSSYATVRRGAYHFADKATLAFETSRQFIADFIGANSPDEIVFTSGTTQAINLVAYSFSRTFLKEGDEVIITGMEHHANIVPWQVLVEDKGIVLKVIPVDDRGELLMEEYDRLLSTKTKLVSVVYISNVLGTVNPVKEIIDKAHLVGAKVLIDGAQSAAHKKVNVKELDCDFYAFSSHKIYGPNGVGILYGKYELFDSMKPYVCGGDMIEKVTFEKTSYAKPPRRFEAGTPPITQALGLKEALFYVSNLGFVKIEEYEQSLLNYATECLLKVDGLNIIGRARDKAGVISFDLEGVHPHDLGSILDRFGVAVRGGHHCAQPLMKRFKVPATTRISMAFYNTFEDIDVLMEGLQGALKIFRK